MKSESKFVLTLLVALPLVLFVAGLIALTTCSKRSTAESPTTSPLLESDEPAVDVITANSTYVPINQSRQVWSIYTELRSDTVDADLLSRVLPRLAPQ
jgi:hypothetical protein